MVSGSECGCASTLEMTGMRGSSTCVDASAALRCQTCEPLLQGKLCTVSRKHERYMLSDSPVLLKASEISKTHSDCTACIFCCLLHIAGKYTMHTALP